jgi:hypothetical protein
MAGHSEKPREQRSSLVWCVLIMLDNLAILRRQVQRLQGPKGVQGAESD